MCGIVGYVGSGLCADVLIEGLKKLEYRGYDSAGVAIATDKGVQVVRATGKLRNLERAYLEAPFDGHIGLGHTRWATHGRPSHQNAHPHCAGSIVVVHNGIIENYAALKQELQAGGATFDSDTDTEVVAHLINRELDRLPEGTPARLHQAVQRSLSLIHGSYALVVMTKEDPTELVVARFASPMVLGTNAQATFVASDVPAVLAHTREFVFLQDGDTARIHAGSFEVFDAQGDPVARPTKHISWDPISAEKQGYKHFMLKEIFEQPARIIDTLRGRINATLDDVSLAEIEIDADWLRQIDRVVIVACGTSYYAAQIGKYFIERHARVPVEVDLASEFRYRHPILTPKTLCIALSQSGETADTLAAMRQAQELGARALGICNVVESTIAREADGVFYTHAGPEISVASTKAFSTQLAAMGMLAIWLGRRRQTLAPKDARQLLDALRQTPTLMESLLKDLTPYERIAKHFSHAHSFLFLGRGPQCAIAYEGALKLKEISYIHAEGYAAGEMKHGPIALIDEDLPLVVIAPKNEVYDKVSSNLEEVKARGGRVIAIVTEGDTQVEPFAEEVLFIPEAHEFIQPLLTVVITQLLAYHIADFKGTDIDQPRNLAKSVTVE